MKVLADSTYGRSDLWERVRDDLGCDLDVVELLVGPRRSWYSRRAIRGVAHRLPGARPALGQRIRVHEQLQ